jgi:hypothetical protein
MFKVTQSDQILVYFLLDKPKRKVSNAIMVKQENTVTPSANPELGCFFYSSLLTLFNFLFFYCWKLRSSHYCSQNHKTIGNQVAWLEDVLMWENSSNSVGELSR